jgi:hypothetical protein
MPHGMFIGGTACSWTPLLAAWSLVNGCWYQPFLLSMIRRGLTAGVLTFCVYAHNGTPGYTGDKDWCVGHVEMRMTGAIAVMDRSLAGMVQRDRCIHAP